MPREYVYVSNYGEIWRMTLAQWSRVVRVNARGGSINMPGKYIGHIKAHIHNMDEADFQDLIDHGEA